MLIDSCKRHIFVNIMNNNLHNLNVNNVIVIIKFSRLTLLN